MRDAKYSGKNLHIKATHYLVCVRKGEIYWVISISCKTQIIYKIHEFGNLASQTKKLQTVVNHFFLSLFTITISVIFFTLLL